MKFPSNVLISAPKSLISHHFRRFKCSKTWKSGGRMPQTDFYGSWCRLSHPTPTFSDFRRFETSKILWNQWFWSKNQQIWRKFSGFQRWFLQLHTGWFELQWCMLELREGLVGLRICFLEPLWGLGNTKKAYWSSQEACWIYILGANNSKYMKKNRYTKKNKKNRTFFSKAQCTHPLWAGS